MVLGTSGHEMYCTVSMIQFISVIWYMKLHWLPIEQRVLYKVLLLTYKSLNGKVPEYLKELLTCYVPNPTLRYSIDSRQNKLIVPKTHYSATEKRAFGIRAPSEWNKHPSDLHNKASVDAFKQALKTHLFKVAYE